MPAALMEPPRETVLVHVCPTAGTKQDPTTQLVKNRQILVTYWAIVFCKKLSPSLNYRPSRILGHRFLVALLHVLWCAHAAARPKSSNSMMKHILNLLCREPFLPNAWITSVCPQSFKPNKEDMLASNSIRCEACAVAVWRGADADIVDVATELHDRKDFRAAAARALHFTATEKKHSLLQRQLYDLLDLRRRLRTGGTSRTSLTIEAWSLTARGRHAQTWTSGSKRRMCHSTCT